MPPPRFPWSDIEDQGLVFFRCILDVKDHFKGNARASGFRFLRGERCFESLFGEIIFSYTRAQSIADRALIDVTPTAAEAGFRFLVALNRPGTSSWENCCGILSIAAISSRSRRPPGKGNFCERGAGMLTQLAALPAHFEGTELIVSSSHFQSSERLRGVEYTTTLPLKDED